MRASLDAADEAAENGLARLWPNIPMSGRAGGASGRDYCRTFGMSGHSGDPVVPDVISSAKSTSRPFP